MRKIAYLLAMAAAVAFASPLMAQNSNSPNGGGVVVGNTPGQAQVPQPANGDVNWKGVGIGAGTVAGNLLYVPAKVVYGILGGITGGASYLLTGGNTQTADTIWRSSLGGDYVLTPDMVSGQKPIHFSGPTTTAGPNAAPATAGSAAMNSAPAASNAPPARTASADIGGAVNSAPIAGDSAATGAAVPQAADRGAGPVNSSASTSTGAASVHDSAGGVAAPPLPGTSIE